MRSSTTSESSGRKVTEAGSSDRGTASDVVTLHRRTVDRTLNGFGVVATVAFLVAGSLLLWGSRFSADYVERELSSQNVTFPSADDLRTEGRDDLVGYADEKVTTGGEAEAYASYINGHLQAVANGKTYSEIDDRGARAAVEEATANGADAEQIAQLQQTADELTAQRDTLFKGETLRGLLLSAYAWSTVGAIAGYAAIAAFGAALVMAALVVAGFVHIARQARPQT